MKKRLNSRIAIALLVGFLFGAAWLVAIRFATFKSDNVHYHANFALYVDGTRDTFDSFTFYEEVQSCGSDEKNNPKNRAHMHDEINHVVHVHEPGVTWEHFFANLGYTLGDEVIKTDDGVYVDSESGSNLTFWLNGEQVNTIANQVIESEDVLLIDYGTTNDEMLQKRYDAIKKDAGAYNKRNDPSSCSGAEELTIWERLKQSVGIGNS